MEHRNDIHPPIWPQLNTKKLGDNPASDVQLVSDPVHMEYSNRQTIGDIALVNAAGMRDGSGIPGTGQAFNVQLTDNSRTNWFTPALGEVYSLMAFSASANQAPSSAYVFTMFYQVKDQDGTSRVIPVATSGDITNALVPLFPSSSDRAPIYPAAGQYVDNNVTVQIQVDAMQGTTTIDCSVYVMRVR